jgi:hypothetical protein
MFLMVTKMTQLQTLKLTVNEVTPKAFKSIKFLKSLNELKMIKNDADEHDHHLKILSQIQNPSLTKLEILYPCTNINGIVFMLLGLNCQNLQHLYINSAITTGFVMNIANNMKNLKSLTLNHPKRFTILEQNVDLLLSTNTKMLKLTLSVEANNELSFIPNMLKQYPCVEVLKVQTSLIGTELELLVQKIFDHLQKLRELELVNQSPLPLNPSTIKQLKSHADHLKRVKLHSVFIYNSFNKRTFANSFSVVKLHEDKLELLK